MVTELKHWQHALFAQLITYHVHILKVVKFLGPLMNRFGIAILSLPIFISPVL